MLKQEIEDGQASLADPQFRADVLTGLALRPRAIPARWLYDRRGSELFDEITRLPEYYPTRTETALLEQCRGELAKQINPGAAVIEFGAGSATKTPLLLKAISPSAYVPIDISGDYLRSSADVLQSRFQAATPLIFVLQPGLAHVDRLPLFPEPSRWIVRLKVPQRML